MKRELFIFLVLFGVYLMVHGFGFALQHALSSYEDADGKSFEELNAEIPKKHREISVIKCNFAVVVAVCVAYLPVKALFNYYDQSIQNYLFIYVHIGLLIVVCLLSAYTDYKYAVISSIMTSTLIAVGLGRNVYLLFTTNSVGMMDSPYYKLALFSIITLFCFIAEDNFNIGISRGDISLFQGIALFVPIGLTLKVIIFTCYLGLIQYVIRGVISLVKTKKWTSDNGIRLGVFLGPVGIYFAIQYLLTLIS